MLIEVAVGTAPGEDTDPLIEVAVVTAPGEDTGMLIEGSSVLPVRPPRTPACSSRWRSSRHPARTRVCSSRWRSARHPARTPACSSSWISPRHRRGHRYAHRGFVRPSSQAATDTGILIELDLATAPGEDTGLLIEVAVVLRSVRLSVARRPSRYDHLPALAIVPLRRFCEPAFPVRPSVRQFGWGATDGGHGRH
jgi:hypothetical protein